MRTRSILCNAVCLAAPLACLLLACGCDNSSDSSARKQSADNVNAAQRSIRASQQTIVLQSGEIQSASRSQVSDVNVSVDTLMQQSASASQTVVERLAAQESNLAQIQALMSEIEQTRQSVTPENEVEYVNRLQAAANALVVHARQLNQGSQQESQARLEQARKLLEEAEKSGRQVTSERRDMEFSSAPGSALGTLQLIFARKYASLMEGHYNALQPQLIEFNQVLGVYLQQDKLAAIQVTRKPDYMVDLGGAAPTNTIEQLRAIQKKTETMLQAVRVQVTALNGQIETLQQSYRALSGQAKELRGTYLKTLAQADNEKGQKRFDLQQAAYTLETGADGKGCIYLETQVELAEKELQDMNNQLAYLKNRDRDLAASSARLADMLLTLQTAPATTSDIEAMAALHEKNAAASLVKLQAVVESIRKSAEAYRETRAATVDAFKLARSRFSAAAQSAPGGYKNYCLQMINTIKLNMVQMWRQDAAYYESILNVLDLAQTIPATAPFTAEFFAACQKLTETAIDASEEDDLKIEPVYTDPPVEAAPDLVPPDMTVDPAANGDSNTTPTPGADPNMTEEDGDQNL